MLPADAGCVVDNVETIISIYNAVVKGIPSMERVVTVTGDGVVNPGNYKVLFGTNQNELIEAAGGLKEGCEKVISGGPMMGFAMYTTDTPITKTSSSILCMSKMKYQPVNRQHVSTADGALTPVQAALFRQDWLILQNAMTKKRSSNSMVLSV